MREIKFRAWDKVSKKILYQESLAILTNGKVIITAPKVLDVNQKDETYLDRTGEFEIQQFTGLLDKKGKEIYEGDIIRCGDYVEDAGAYNEWQSEVVWNNEQGMWQGIDGERNEIIGNIYSNPELIK